ncbi:MAG: patatin-like phospholipase family protein, partial [Pseudomonadota bacterium]
MNSDPNDSPRFGLVLSGGGARAAYQVGVLRGIATALPRDTPNPFHIIAGTSAGALNAASLATHAQRLRTGVRALEYIWRHIDSSQVYRLDTRGLLGNAASWAFSFLFNRKARHPVSLLDNSPLEELLTNVLRMGRLQQNMDAGHLETISITASAYYSGNSVSFFQTCRDIPDWDRPHRVGVNTGLSIR